MENVFLDVLIDQTFWILQSFNLLLLPLLLSFLHLRSVSSQEFIERIGKIHDLNYEFLFRETHNEKP